jgi:hypothetical protein
MISLKHSTYICMPPFHCISLSAYSFLLPAPDYLLRVRLLSLSPLFLSFCQLPFYLFLCLNFSLPTFPAFTFVFLLILSFSSVTTSSSFLGLSFFLLPLSPFSLLSCLFFFLFLCLDPFFFLSLPLHSFFFLYIDSFLHPSLLRPSFSFLCLCLLSPFAAFLYYSFLDLSFISPFSVSPSLPFLCPSFFFYRGLSFHSSILLTLLFPSFPFSASPFFLLTIPLLLYPLFTSPFVLISWSILSFSFLCLSFFYLCFSFLSLFSTSPFFLLSLPSPMVNPF